MRTVDEESSIPRLETVILRILIWGLGRVFVRMYRWLKNLRAPDKLVLSLLFAVAAGLLGNAVYAWISGVSNGKAQTPEGQIGRLECPDIEGSPVLLNGEMKFAARNGVKLDDDQYSVFVKPGDTVQANVWLFNRDTTRDISDVRVQVRAPHDSGSVLAIEALACSEVAAPFTSASTLVGSSGPVAVRFVPDSVLVRAWIDGEYRTRQASDSLFESEYGESISRINASTVAAEAHVNVSVMLKIVEGES